MRTTYTPAPHSILLTSIALTCNTSMQHGVGMSGDNIAFTDCPNIAECSQRCCELAACQAWTWVNRAAGEMVCYLKSAAVPEACEGGDICVSWSRATPLPPCSSAHSCDRGWQKDAQGCCTRLALASGSSPVGVVALPHGANLSTNKWEDRPYPWGGDAVLSADGKQVHGFFAEFANHCPMTYGTWYSSTRIRHAVAPADAVSGLPNGPFVVKDIAIPTAAGNPVVLTKGRSTTTADGYHVLFTTNQRFHHPVRNCSGRDPGEWHKEAVYNSGSPMGINLAWAPTLDGPWTVRLFRSFFGSRFEV
jgi:hypothetical protein